MVPILFIFHIPKFWDVTLNLGITNPSFFLASPNLGDEISFKGGSLSHPKTLECEINKIRTMYAYID
jgi:hypothetical protein